MNRKLRNECILFWTLALNTLQTLIRTLSNMQKWVSSISMWASKSKGWINECSATVQYTSIQHSCMTTVAKRSPASPQAAEGADEWEEPGDPGQRGSVLLHRGRFPGEGGLAPRGGGRWLSPGALWGDLQRSHTVGPPSVIEHLGHILYHLVYLSHRWEQGYDVTSLSSERPRPLFGYKKAM